METGITVRYIHQLPEFGGMKLIAGRSGLDNVIKACTILDYEYEKSVINKYTHIHFEPGQFIVTSFLYAKDNEFLIMDAVKRLIERGCSGLAIRNVFRLPISDSVIRYADTKGFPIFIMKDVSIYFEEFISIITNLVRRNKSLQWAELYVDKLLKQSLGPQEAYDTLLQINPSFGTEYCVLYFERKEPITYDHIATIFDLLQPLLSNTDSLFCYKNGVMLIHTHELFHVETEKEVARNYMDALGDKKDTYNIGVSHIHHDLSEMKQAINECLYATIYNGRQESAYTTYPMLGVYQLVLPHAADKQFDDYCRQYTTSLLNYDDENNTKLFITAEQYVLSDGDLKTTAEVLSQHKNTIRYRIDKISKLYNDDVTEKSGYEKMSLAFKIYFSRSMLESYRGLVGPQF